MVSAAAPQSQPSAEDEALKRNTDCVYFLASPLTCKKGSECEYRHSDIARLNPRDCYFWLNGNCLNPKCAFRHPPLDGLLGTQTPTSTGTAQPILQTATTPSPQVVSATSKPGVPCKFFQSGFCLKGDWCPFLHAPNSAKNKASLVPVTASAFGPSNSKKDVQEKKVPPTNTSKPIKESSDPQAAGKTEPALRRNEVSVNNKISGTSSINKLSDYNNGGIVSWSNRFHQSHPLDEPGHIDNKGVGDVSREPSPGFDVLVDDEMRDPNIYHGEDRYGMSREYETRNEFDIDHFTDYNMIAEDNNDRHHDYESNRYRKGQYISDQNRASSERSSYLKRRPYAWDDNRDQVDGLDLRHRLARNKQPNGLRSVISHEHAHDKHVEDQNLRETSRSSRLRGRIRLPQRSSSPIDRDTEHGRLSPVRARPSSNQGRILDRMKGRVEEVSNDGWKNHRGLHSRRDAIGDYNADFNGPRSLAELKHRKNVEPSGQRVMMDREQLGKRKYSGVDGHQQNGNDLSFEGPKPLQEILKRKRRDISVSISNNISSTNGEIIEESNNQKEGKDRPSNSVSIERTEAEERETALEPVDSKVEGEIIKSGVEQESEVYEEREEFDAEHDGGEDYELYEGDDNGEGEGEYVEDEDDDDEEFAKKMGVVYS